MASVKNQKQATVLFAIAVLAGVLLVSTVAIGSVHTAFGQVYSRHIVINNTGVFVPADTNQQQDCQGTAGANSPIGTSCTASSTDTITQSGGNLKK